MYTLVYKDVLAILKSKATVPSLICIGAALVAMHGSSPVGLFLLCMPTYYFVAYSGMYDYKYAQERFYLSLPVSRSEWILSRYLSCLLVAFATLLLAFAAGSAGSFLGLPVHAPEAVDAVLAIFASCLTIGFLFLRLPTIPSGNSGSGMTCCVTTGTLAWMRSTNTGLIQPTWM